MKKGEWTFLSNHGRVLAHITRCPQKTTQTIAQELGLSIRGVQIILGQLEEKGYLERRKVGRCNQYAIHPEMPLRSSYYSKHTIGEILEAVGAMPRHTFNGGRVLREHSSMIPTWRCIGRIQ